MRKSVLLAILALVLAAPAFAQRSTGSIRGVVKDATGAVLPGVTVEAASPALIEKVRSVVTDASGNSATKPLTLLVKPLAPLSITSSQLPRASVGTTYSQSIGAAGGLALLALIAGTVMIVSQRRRNRGYRVATH